MSDYFDEIHDWATQTASDYFAPPPEPEPYVNPRSQRDDVAVDSTPPAPRQTIALQFDEPARNSDQRAIKDFQRQQSAIRDFKDYFAANPIPIEDQVQLSQGSEPSVADQLSRALRKRLSFALGPTEEEQQTEINPGRGIVPEVGRFIKRSGEVAKGSVEDVAAGISPDYGPYEFGENTRAAIDEKQTPLQSKIKDVGGLPKIAANVSGAIADMIPAMVVAGPVGGLAESGLARAGVTGAKAIGEAAGSGLVFGLDESGWDPKKGAMMALFPAVSKVGGSAMTGLLGELGVTFQSKAAEQAAHALGGLVASQTYMEITALPDYLNMTPEQRWEHFSNNLGVNLALHLAQVPGIAAQGFGEAEIKRSAASQAKETAKQNYHDVISEVAGDLVKRQPDYFSTETPKPAQQPAAPPAEAIATKTPTVVETPVTPAPVVAEPVAPSDKGTVEATLPAESSHIKISSAESSALENLRNGTGDDIESFRDSSEGKSFISKLNGLIKRPTKSTKPVDLNMLPLGDDLKIVDGVVQSIPITMVNDLLSGELSSKMLLHNDSMFKLLPPDTVDSNADEPITGVVPRKSSDVSAVAGSSHAPIITDDSSNVNSSEQQEKLTANAGQPTPEIQAFRRAEKAGTGPTSNDGVTRADWSFLDEGEKAKRDAVLARIKARKPMGGTKFSTTLFPGIDPEFIADAQELAGIYAKAGVRNFKEFAGQMITDLGDAVKPVLQDLYQKASGLLNKSDVRYAAELQRSYLSSVPTEELTTHLMNLPGRDLNQVLKLYPDVHNEFGSPTSLPDAPTDPKQIDAFNTTDAGKRRLAIVAGLADQVKSAAPEDVGVKKLGATESISPDHIDFEGNYLASTEEKKNQATEPAYFEINQRALSKNPTDVLNSLVSGARDKSQSEKPGSTRRVVAFQDNATGEVYLSSVWKDNKANVKRPRLGTSQETAEMKPSASERVKIVDPNKVVGKANESGEYSGKTSTSLYELLNAKTETGKPRYTLLSSARLNVLTDGYLQKYKTKADFDAHFGRASDVMESAKAGAEKMESIHSALSSSSPKESGAPEDEAALAAAAVEGGAAKVDTTRADVGLRGEAADAGEETAHEATVPDEDTPAHIDTTEALSAVPEEQQTEVVISPSNHITDKHANALWVIFEPHTKDIFGPKADSFAEFDDVMDEILDSRTGSDALKRMARAVMEAGIKDPYRAVAYVKERIYEHLSEHAGSGGPAFSNALVSEFGDPAGKTAGTGGSAKAESKGVTAVGTAGKPSADQTVRGSVDKPITDAITRNKGLLDKTGVKGVRIVDDISAGSNRPASSSYLAIPNDAGEILISRKVLDSIKPLFKTAKALDNFLDAVIAEEAIHAVGERVLSQKEVEDVWASLTDAQRQHVLDTYVGTKTSEADSGFTPYQLGHEFLRQYLQNKMFGTITERLYPDARTMFEKVADSVKAIVRKVVAAARALVGKDAVAKSAIDRMEAEINAPTKSAGFRGGSEAPGAKVETPEEYEHQKKMGEEMVPEKTVAAYEAPVRIFSAVADSLKLNDRVRSMLRIPKNDDLLKLAQADSSVMNYHQAVAAAKTPGQKAEVTLGAYHELESLQNDRVNLKSKLAEQKALIESKAFQKRMESIGARQAKIEEIRSAANTFKSQVAQEVSAVMEEMNQRGQSAARSDELNQHLQRLKQLPDFTEAVKQRVDKMVSRLVLDTEGLRLLTVDNKQNGETIAKRYADLEAAAGTSAQEIRNEQPFVELAAHVLAANRDAAFRLALLEHLKQDPDFAAELTEVGQQFKAAFAADPQKAIRDILTEATSENKKIFDARNSWLRLNKAVTKDLQLFKDLTTAVRASDVIDADPQWKQITTDVYADAKAIRVPDVVRAASNGKEGLVNEFYNKNSFVAPDGKIHTVSFGYTKADAFENWKQVGDYLASIDDWLSKTDNIDSPDRQYWQTRRDFVDAVYYVTSTSMPTANRPIGLTHSWFIPDYLLDQMQIPGAKIARVAFENFGSAYNSNDGWVHNHSESIINTLAKGALSHDFKLSDGLGRYREDVLNQLGWLSRAGKPVEVGTVLDNGLVITREDMAALRTQGEAINKLFTANRVAGRENVMQDNLLFDEWANGQYGVRQGHELGSAPGTTLPRYFSDRGRTLALAVHELIQRTKTNDAEISPQALNAIEDLLNQSNQFDFVRYFLSQRKSSFISKASPYEEAYRAVAEEGRTGTPPQSIDDVVNLISQHTAEDVTPEEIKKQLMTEMVGRLQKFYNTNLREPESASTLSVTNTEKDSALSRAFKNDVETSFFYDYGLANAGEVRAIAMDASNFHVVRIHKALDSLERTLNTALVDLKTATDKKTFKADARAAHAAGDDFRNFDQLENQLSQVRRMKQMLPSFSGTKSVEAALVSQPGLVRATGNIIGFKLTGAKTATRILSSFFKMGTNFAAMDRGLLVTTPKAIASLAMSALKILPQAGARVAYRIAVNSPKALRAMAETKGGVSVKVAEGVRNALDGISREIINSSSYLRQQYDRGLITDDLLGDRLANMILMPESRGNAYDRKLGDNWLVRLPKQAMARALLTAEVPLELMRFAFPNAFYYTVYDAAARQAGWTIDVLDAQARRAFDVHEKLGTLSRFNLNNASDPVNELSADQVLPRQLLLPKTQGHLNQTRDWFRAIDVPYNEQVIRYWKRLSQTPPNERAKIHLLSADEQDEAKAQDLKERRATALMAVSLRDVHHASPTNRSWLIRSTPGIRIINPVLGWGSQSMRQFASVFGQATHDPKFKQGALRAFTAASLLAGIGVAVLSGESEKRAVEAVDRFVNGNVSGIKHLSADNSTGDNIKIGISDASSYISVLNTVMNTLLGLESSRGGLNLQPMLVDEANSLLRLGQGIVHTKDLSYGVAKFIGQEAPGLRPLVNRLPSEEGLTELRNANTVLRKYGPSDILKASGGYVPVPTELSPFKQRLTNAIYSGDQAAVQKAYEDFIKKAAELGRPKPEQLASQVFRSVNPYSQVFGGKLDPEQRDALIAKASPSERQLLQQAEKHFQDAAQTVGANTALLKTPGGSGASSGRSILGSGANRLPRSMSASANFGLPKVGSSQPAALPPTQSSQSGSSRQSFRRIARRSGSLSRGTSRRRSRFSLGGRSRLRSTRTRSRRRRRRILYS